MESDCLVVVNAVFKKEKIYSPFGSAVDDCRSILRSYNNIDIVCPPDLRCILEDDLK